MVKELAEQRHKAVKRRSIAKVGHHVGDNKIAILHFNTGQRQLRCRFSYSCIARQMCGIANCACGFCGCKRSVKLGTACWHARGGQGRICLKQRLVSSQSFIDANAGSISKRHDAVVQWA